MNLQYILIDLLLTQNDKVRLAYIVTVEGIIRVLIHRTSTVHDLRHNLNGLNVKLSFAPHHVFQLTD